MNMTTEQARDIVKSHYPYACAKKCGDWRIIDAADPNNVVGLSIRCPTEHMAWISAANRVIAKQKDQRK